MYINIQAPVHSPDPLPMECLSVNDGTGQAYGYIMYRTTIPSSSEKVTITKLRDYGLVRPLTLQKASLQ